MSLSTRFSVGIVLASLSLVSAQAGSQFEVASIRPSAPAGQSQVQVGLHIDGAQVRVASFSLKDYVALAYRIKASLISGPDWTATERFDIVATLPEGSKTSELPEMFQALLAERFQLKIHREKKEFPVYALTVGKGPLKLKESPPDPNADKDEPAGTVNVSGGGSAAGVGVNLGHGSSYAFANNRFEGKKLTMAQFAQNLERFADRQMIDMTDLKGVYDFAIEVTPEDYRIMLIRAGINSGVVLPPQAMALVEGVSSAGPLSDALQQVGLKLDARKAPLDTIVIDDAQKTPSAN